MEQYLAHEGVSRRGLLKLVMTAGLGLAAAGTVDPVFAYADGQGLSRDGVKARFFIGSDLHINNNTGAEPRDADKKLQFAFDTAYALDPELDAFCLVGDLTDNGNEGQYKRLMSLINDGGAHNKGYADGAGHTQMILCQGNHETYSPGVSGAPARFKEYTGQEATKVVAVNGVTVITMGPAANGSGDGDYRPHYDWFGEQLRTQVGNATEPFLVLTHHQMRGSSYTSPEWHGTFGQGEERDFQKLMAQYPNLIQVSGHSHATLEDERSISQDLGFTAIQDATIGAYYENETGKVDPESGNGASVPPQSADIYTPGSFRQEASQAVILDFMDNNTVKAYRISLVRAKAEGEGVVYLYEPWIIDPTNMQAYTSARTSTAAPVWPADAAVTVDEVAHTSAKVHFPTAQPGSSEGDDMVHEYKLVATADDGSSVTKRVFNDYYRPAAYIRNTWDVLINGLSAETTYTLSVYAQTSWNKEVGSEGAGTWTDSEGPAVNSTSVALISAPFTTAAQPASPRAILDIDYRTGSNEDAMGHTATFEAGPAVVSDEELGYTVLEADGHAGWGYQLEGTDYEAFVGASTHECLFKLVDNQTDQCLFSNQQSAGAGFEVENGQIEFWYNNDQARRIIGTPVETGTWVHAIATYDGTNVTLYVNGEQVAQESAGTMTVPSPNRYYVCSDVSTSNTSEICAAAGTRVAFARLFPYAMTAGQVSTAFAASKLAPAPAKLLDVDFAACETGADVEDAAGHAAVHPELAATASLVFDEKLGQNVFACDGASAFGFAFTEDDYTYLGNEHALECVFMAHDLDTDQCFISNQQSSGDGLEIAGDGDTHGKMAFWFNSNDSGTPKPAGAVSADVWHHAIGVYACGKVRLYIDGKLCEELEAQGGLEVPPANCRNYYVGADVYTGGGAQIFTQPGSKIARAAILAKAPSREEIAQLAAGFPLDPNAPEPVDKTALAEAVDASAQLVESDWTAASWQAFATALAEAEAVLDDAASSQEEVDAALDALESAKANLVKASSGGTGTGDGGNTGAGDGGNTGGGNTGTGGQTGGNTGGGQTGGNGGNTGSKKPSSKLPSTGDASLLAGGIASLLGATTLSAGLLALRHRTPQATAGDDLAQALAEDDDIDA